MLYDRPFTVAVEAQTEHPNEVAIVANQMMKVAGLRISPFANIPDTELSTEPLTPFDSK